MKDNNNLMLFPDCIVKEINMDFEQIYAKYPRKIGHKEAQRHFKASVKNEQDYADIQKALVNYLQCKEVKSGFIQHASRWFNNWRDWVNIEPLPTVIQQFKKCSKCSRTAMIDNLCGICFAETQKEIL